MHHSRIPGGTYAYFVTIDASGTPLYPFVIGPTYYGTVQSGNTGPTGGHVVISEATTVYTGPTVTTSIAGVEQEIKFNVVPNPSSDYVFIYMDNESKNNVKMNLFNEEGKLIKTIDFMQPSVAYTLDMTQYAAGTYVLVMESATQRRTQKIIKTQ
ncbi:MAG: T9SS type A sorting domain-containing protein [Bacteroidia bacterium]|nr:T9SS type A sorting domain-containing protein [Bacteroidia bacterium]